MPRTPRRTGTAFGLAAWCTLGLAAPAALAELTYDEVAAGLDLVTIGDPGNRVARQDEFVFGFGSPNIGRVDYRYRIARTEVTVGMWQEFVNAYLPYYDGGLSNDEFTGNSISIFSGQARLRPGESPDEPTTMGWQYAARYLNWLHNGKAPEQAAFESGAYDTSTFTENDDGTGNYQQGRSEGARFWIPSFDELTKAAFWDPNKDGEGGYWPFPNGTNEEPVPGLPENGGQRNAGTILDGDFPIAVGSYPDQASAFGILDYAGGVQEWTDSGGGEPNVTRFVLGSPFNQTGVGGFRAGHELGTVEGRTIGTSDFIGLRIASVVPAPGSAVLMVGVGGMCVVRRGRGARH